MNNSQLPAAGRGNPPVVTIDVAGLMFVFREWFVSGTDAHTLGWHGDDRLTQLPDHVADDLGLVS